MKSHDSNYQNVSCDFTSILSKSVKHSFLPIYNLSGATISENESFSLTSDEDLQVTSKEATHETSSQAAESNEETHSSTMLPANHVIQYSPRLIGKTSIWTPELQTYQNPETEEDKVEPMEIDNRDSTDELSMSCPLYPRGECHVVKTELRLDLQLDHDQNSNVPAGEAAVQEDLKGDINQTEKIAETPSPKPRSSLSQNSAPLETSPVGNRKPVPTPRKSVTLMEVDPQPQQGTTRAASALSHHEKKISFSIGKIIIDKSEN